MKFPVASHGEFNPRFAIKLGLRGFYGAILITFGMVQIIRGGRAAV